MRNWLRRIASWLGRAKHFFVMLGGFFIALCLLLAWRPTESHLRITGLLLQLLGLYTVLRGISATRTLFGLPTLTASVLAWLRSFPKRRPAPVTISGVGGIGSLTGSGRVTIRSGLGPNPTLEDRVHVLEQNLASMDIYTVALQQQVDEAKHITEEALSKERSLRQTEVHTLSRRLELSETGGLDISLMGLIWLMLGLVMSTASYELAGTFGR